MYICHTWSEQEQNSIQSCKSTMQGLVYSNSKDEKDVSIYENEQSMTKQLTFWTSSINSTNDIQMYDKINMQETSKRWLIRCLFHSAIRTIIGTHLKDCDNYLIVAFYFNHMQVFRQLLDSSILLIVEAWYWSLVWKTAYWSMVESRNVISWLVCVSDACVGTVSADASI